MFMSSRVRTTFPVGSKEQLGGYYIIDVRLLLRSPKEEETMRKLSAFNNVSLDGYFTDANGDMSWAHNNDPEWNAFAAENASGGGTLLMGRITYELMASFWPTPQAMQSMPAVATACRRSWSPERSTRRRGATRRS